MTETASQRRTGIALVLAAAVAWSTAPFFTRLLPLESWTILFWRGLFGGATITVVLVLTQGWAGLRDFTRMGGNGWLVAILSTKIPLYLGTSPLPLPPVPPQIGFWAVLHEIRSEYAQLMTSIFLLIAGPGRWSLDAFLARKRPESRRTVRHAIAV